MTNIDLKTQIDNAITNKTAASSITPTDVGNNCKAIVDYADQQDLLLVNLTGSQSITGSKIFTNTLVDPAIQIISNQPSVNGMFISNTGGADGLLISNISGTGLHITNSDVSAPSIFLDNTGTGSGLVIFAVDGNGIDLVCNGTGYGIRMENLDQIGFDLTMSGNGSGINIANNGGSGKALTIVNSNSVSSDVFVYKKNVTTRATLADSGILTTQGFIKEGGTSSEFLMADGSVSTPSFGVTYTEEPMNATTTGFANTDALISKNYTRVFIADATNSFIALSATGVVTGESFSIYNTSTDITLKVKFINNAVVSRADGFTSNSNYIVPPRTTVRFTMSDITSGSEKVFLDELLFNSTARTKIFDAQLTQSGLSAPSISIKGNSTGRTFTPSYDDVGAYLITISGTTLTASQISAYIGDNQLAIDFNSIRVFSDNVIKIETNKLTAGALVPTNGLMNFTPIKIEINE